MEKIRTVRIAFSICFGEKHDRGGVHPNQLLPLGTALCIQPPAL